MLESDVARLTRLAYARDSTDHERMLALTALKKLATDAAVAHRAADAEARSEAERTASRAAERLGRVRMARVAALVTAAVVLIGGAAAFAASGAFGGGTSLPGSATSIAGGFVPLKDTDRSSAGTGAHQDESSSYGIGGVPQSSGADPSTGASSGSGTGASTASGPVSADGSSTTYSNATGTPTTPGSTSERFGSDGSSVPSLGGSAALSPAVIFTAAQTAADHPAAVIPGDTVESTYRLLSRGQYTPGSAYAALSSDGRMCLVVFGGDSDYGETCQSVRLTLSRGLQAGVTSSTNLNPRSGSKLVTLVHFAATWNADGTFLLAVTGPGSTQPNG